MPLKNLMKHDAVHEPAHSDANQRRGGDEGPGVDWRTFHSRLRCGRDASRVRTGGRPIRFSRQTTIPSTANGARVSARFRQTPSPHTIALTALDVGQSGQASCVGLEAQARPRLATTIGNSRRIRPMWSRAVTAKASWNTDCALASALVAGVV